MMDDFGDAIARIRASMNGADPWDDWDEIRYRIEAGHAARLARWEAGRPMRERAEAVYHAANARRRAELGLPAAAPIPIAASLLWAAPPSASPFF